MSYITPNSLQHTKVPVYPSTGTAMQINPTGWRGVWTAVSTGGIRRLQHSGERWRKQNTEAQLTKFTHKHVLGNGWNRWIRNPSAIKSHFHFIRINAIVHFNPSPQSLLAPFILNVMDSSTIQMIYGSRNKAFWYCFAVKFWMDTKCHV